MENEITKKYVTDLSYKIINAAIEVHNELGPGLLESIYEDCLEYELRLRGFKVEKQVITPVKYKEFERDTPLKLDLLVNGLVAVELKTVESLLPIHESIILSYMKLLKVPQGLLINFHTVKIIDSYRPFVNEYFTLLK